MCQVCARSPQMLLHRSRRRASLPRRRARTSVYAGNRPQSFQRNSHLRRFKTTGMVPDRRGHQSDVDAVNCINEDHRVGDTGIYSIDVELTDTLAVFAFPGCRYIPAFKFRRGHAYRRGKFLIGGADSHPDFPCRCLDRAGLPDIPGIERCTWQGTGYRCRTSRPRSRPAGRCAS